MSHRSKQGAAGDQPEWPATTEKKEQLVNVQVRSSAGPSTYGMTGDKANIKGGRQKEIGWKVPGVCGSPGAVGVVGGSGKESSWQAVGVGVGGGG